MQAYDSSTVYVGNKSNVQDGPHFRMCWNEKCKLGRTCWTDIDIERDLSLQCAGKRSKYIICWTEMKV